MTKKINLKKGVSMLDLIQLTAEGRVKYKNDPVKLEKFEKMMDEMRKAMIAQMLKTK